MQPEISHRCLSCGAAVRAGARFCPQCGASMGDALVADASPALAVSPVSTDPAEDTPSTRDFEPPREAAPTTRDFEAQRAPEPAARAPEPARQAERQPLRSEPTRQAEPPPRPEPPGASKTTQEWAPPTKEYAAFVESVKGGAVEAPRAGDGAGDSEAAAEVAAEDASEDARGAGRVARVRGEARARVGRMRDEAIVVLEETPDDHGLRFVVAAAALFLVFLVLLFLSTTVI